MATVIYPLLARHAAERNYVAMATDYRRGVRLILLLNIPAAVGLALLSTPMDLGLPAADSAHSCSERSAASW